MDNLYFILFIFLFQNAEENMKSWEKLPPPSPGEWLYHFAEEEQKFEEYKAKIKKPFNIKGKKICLIPVGNFTEKEKNLLQKLSKFIEVYFQIETQILKGIKPSKSPWNEKREQYDASILLDEILKNMVSNCIAITGITPYDLYVKGLNFVFGLGSETKRAGIYSFYRYGKDENLLKKRLFKVSVHEIGHIFGISHCVKYRCIMNGSNSLFESDRRPIHLCPDCLKKLQWALNFDVISRNKSLIEFLKNEGLKEDAEFLENRIK